MITQVSGKGKLKTWKALLLIIVSVASLYAIEKLLEWLVSRGMPYLMGSILIWLYAAALVVLLFFRFSLVSQYDLDGVKLIFSRVYIRKPRLSEQVLLRELVFFGSPEEAAHRYQCTRTKRYTSFRSKYATQALVLRRNKQYIRILFSPNEEICASLTAHFTK